jgi:hypothetical protein
MTCKYNYKSISLKVDTVEKIKLLSETLELGLRLSNAKTVTKLINDSFERQNNKGTIHVRKQYYKA